MLKIKNISASYGYVEALKEVSIDAEKGQIVSIIGANGAGKTTLLRCISGLVRPESGEIEFLGNSISRKPNDIVKQGIVHVPEGRRTFSGLTVEDNLLVGGYLFDNKTNHDALEEYYNLFPILKERKHQYAGTLSGGEQQMLAIARGLMSQPKIMLLDEPSLGLAPIIVNQVFNLISQIRDRGVTVLLVEQNAKKALGLCDKAYVIDDGQIKLEGTGKELLRSDEVKRAYLGG